MLQCSWVHVAFEATASLTPLNFEAEYYMHIIFGNCITAQLLIRGNNDVSSCVISSDDWSLSIPFWSGFPFWSLALESAWLDVYYWKKVLHMTSRAIYNYLEVNYTYYRLWEYYSWINSYKLLSIQQCWSSCNLWSFYVTCS